MTVEQTLTYTATTQIPEKHSKLFRHVVCHRISPLAINFAKRKLISIRRLQKHNFQPKLNLHVITVSCVANNKIFYQT